MTVSPELEAPERQGSRARGILGAFLGAFLGASLTDALMLFGMEDLGRLIILANTCLMGLAACWGYRLLKGYRSMRFAQWTVRCAILLGQPLAMVAVLTLANLYRQYGTLAVHADTLYLTFLRAVDSLLDGSALVAWALLLFLSLTFVRLGWGVLLKYIDPDWYNDPRRLARIGGGGATFNMPPCWPLPANENIPERFEVDKGKLTVEGDTITVREKRKAQRSFSVKEVAGVVLGVSTGYNILYDKENRMLARFAWSRKNALVFGQYLIQRQVPFVDPNGTPVPVQAWEQPSVPRQFTVREGRLCLVLGWIGTVLLGGATLVCLLLMEGWERLGFTFLGLSLLPLFVSLLLCYYNRRLEVDGEEVSYTTSLGKTTRFRLSDIAEIRVSLDGWKVKDRDGKTLTRFESNMNGADLLLACWNRSKQERNDIL